MCREKLRRKVPKMSTLLWKWMTRARLSTTIESNLLRNPIKSTPTLRLVQLPRSQAINSLLTTLHLDSEKGVLINWQLEWRPSCSPGMRIGNLFKVQVESKRSITMAIIIKMANSRASIMWRPSVQSRASKTTTWGSNLKAQINFKLKPQSSQV